ncbi:MAG: hypothetical protein HQK53_03955 [Oligoflexia bacterium]|nr:hypothetical protein [Oligoflexia bacterium]
MPKLLKLLKLLKQLSRQQPSRLLFATAILSLLILLSNCGSINSSCELRNRSLNDYYQSSGAAEYFLPPLPAWANFNSSANCKRTHITRYLNIPNLRTSFNFSYIAAHQFQYLYNQLWFETQKKLNITENSNSSSHNFISALTAVNLAANSTREEERLFYNVKDNITANNLPFRPPTYSRVNLIWIDPIVNELRKNSTKNKGILERLMKLINSDDSEQGHPVFISLCLFSEEIDKFITDNKLDSADVRIIPQEMFSIFSEKQEVLSGLQLNFDMLFQKSQQLFLYIPNTPNKPKSYYDPQQRTDNH